MRGRGDAEELEGHDLGLVESIDSAADQAQAHRGRWTDIGLAEVGVHHTHEVARRGEGGGQARHQRRLAGVDDTDDECDAGRGGGIQGGRRDVDHTSVAIAAFMRASPSLISASLVA